MGNCFGLSSTTLSQEFHLPESLEKSARYRDQLIDILRHPQLCFLFHEYLRKTFCNEALCFFIEVEIFKDDGLEKIKENSERIYKKYLSFDSEYEVNTSTESLQNLTESLKNPTINCFDDVQQHIFLTMVDDCLPGFLKCSLFSDFVNNPMTRKVFLQKIPRTTSVNRINTYLQRFNGGEDN